jgi:DNA-binding NtrC family response regulator
VPSTVLVLEENAAVHELVDQPLREAGHRVLGTTNVLEALEVVRRVRVDVLVVGALLEERSQSLVGELTSIQPGLRIVSIGGPDDDFDDIDPSARLSSPFALDEVCEAVAASLLARGSVTR